MKPPLSNYSLSIYRVSMLILLHFSGHIHGPLSIQPKPIDHWYITGFLQGKDTTDTGNGTETSMSCPQALEICQVTEAVAGRGTPSRAQESGLV